MIKYCHIKIKMYCSLKFFFYYYMCSGALNTVDSSEESLIREEIQQDLGDSDDEAMRTLMKWW